MGVYLYIIYYIYIATVFFVKPDYFFKRYTSYLIIIIIIKY